MRHLLLLAALLLPPVAQAQPDNAATRKRLVVLVMVATVKPTQSVASLRLGDFGDMRACAAAASEATVVGNDTSLDMHFVCVPLGPASSR